MPSAELFPESRVFNGKLQDRPRPHAPPPPPVMTLCESMCGLKNAAVTVACHSFVTHIPWYRDGIHDSTILLRFLVIILMLLRLAVSIFVFAFLHNAIHDKLELSSLMDMDFSNQRGDMVFCQFFLFRAIDSKESIPLSYMPWRADTTTLFLLGY